MTSMSAADATQKIADLSDAFLSYGADSAGDVDAAFDDAVEQAGYDHGFAGLVPSIASIDADRVEVADLAPVTLERALLIAGRALRSGTLETGHAYALPICPDSTYKRRRVRVTFTDPAVEVSETAGALTYVPDELETLLRAAADEAGSVLDDVELLESATVTAARHRYKPIVTPFKGKSVSEHAVLDPTTGTLIATGHRTAGDARRAAVALAKEGPVGGSATGHLEIVKVTRREDGHPLIRVDRTRQASRVVVKTVFGTVKNPNKVKTIGWLFYGYLPTPADGDQTDTGPTSEPTAEAADGGDQG